MSSSTAGERTRTIVAPPLWVLSAAVVLFGIVAVVASGPTTVTGDEALLDLVQRLPAVPFRPILRTANLIGETSAGPVAVLLLTLACIARRFAAGVVFCLSLLGLRLGAMFLKRVFDSPRPNPSYADIRGHFDGFGFPSGHAITATCIALAVTILAPSLIDRQDLRRAVTTIVWVAAIGCGIARIWYGAHWPTDVVGGMSAAVIMAWLSAWLAERYQRAATKRMNPVRRDTVAHQRSSRSR